MSFTAVSIIPLHWMIRYPFSDRTRYLENHGSSVSSDHTVSTTGVRFWVGAFFSIHCVQTGSGVHPASYPIPGVKRPVRATDRSPPSSAEVNAWSYSSSAPLLHGAVLR